MKAFLVTLCLSRGALAAPAASSEKGTYPDPALTPGAADPGCLVKMVCQHGYTAKVRSVSAATKKAVMRSYGLDPKDSGKYEIDHFISLELCGLNDITNLWPEPYTGIAFPARTKDKVENWLHRQVCAGKISLAEAQDSIRKDWVAAHHQCCDHAP